MKNKKGLLLGLLAMVGLIATFGASANGAKIESTTVDDEHLVHQIENYFSSNPKLSTKFLKIQVNNGFVYVSGLVESKKDLDNIKKGLEKETHATSVDISNLEIMELEERGKK